MNKHLLWLLLLLPNLAHACLATQQAQWQHAAEQASAEQQHSLSLHYYQKIAQCAPLRGDIRVELLRSYLALQQIDNALTERRWLVEHQAPQGLIQLVDTWIARAQLQQALAQPTAAPVRRARLSLGLGYHSNANEVTSNTNIPVEIDGIPLTLELLERPRSSSTQTLGLDIQQRRAQRDLYLGGQLQQFKRINETDLRLFGGMIQRQSCWTPKYCEFSLHLLHQERENNHQQQLQLGTALRSQRQTYGLYYRFLNSNNEPDAYTLGMDWRYLRQNMQWHTALEHEQANSFRPGGDRTRLLISTTVHPVIWPGWQVQLSHQQEWDQDPYAPVFWGNTHRDRRITRARLEYSQPLTPAWLIQTELHWQDTHSKLPLFSHDGWSANIRLHRQW